MGPGTHDRLLIRLLGSPLVELDGRPIEVDTRKATAMLAYLAVRGAPQARESMAALLWPDYEPDGARGALRRTLSALRAALADRWIEADRRAIALDPAGAWIDVRAFRELVAATAAHAHATAEACPRCVDDLGGAVALWRGDFLAGFALRDSPEFDDWQAFEAESLRRECASALERLVRAHGATARYDQAIALGRRWLAMDTLHEPAYRELMRLHAWSGDRSAAIRRYRECVAALERELGVAPIAETTQLYQAIREGRLAVPPVSGGRAGLDGPEGPQAITTDPQPLATGARATAVPWDRAAGGPLPLVGRELEWAGLRDAYRAIGPDGRLVVLEGEAGIGKTRLAEAFLAEVAGRGAATLAVACHEDEAALACAPLAELLRAGLGRPGGATSLAALPGHWLAEAARLVPEVTSGAAIETPADGPAARARFVEGVARTLTALVAGPDGRWGVVLVDDLHWADESTLEVLAYVVRRLAGRPICMVLAWRPEGIGGDHRLHRLLADAERSGTVVRIVPRRLDDAGVTALVDARLADTDPQTRLAVATHIAHEAEGLPFFVSEYLAQATASLRAAPPVGLGSPEWTDGLPVGVRALLLGRAATASEIGRQVLAAAAVIGGTFDAELLRTTSGRSPDECAAGIDELVGRGLLREIAPPGIRDRASERAAPGYAFAHGRMRDLVYAGTGVARRRLLHARVADALAGRARRTHVVSGQAALVAHHLQAAGREPEAADWYRIAGDHARQLFANAEAAALYDRALSCGHRDPAALHEAIGDLRTLAGEYGAALDAYEAATALGTPTLAILEQKLGSVHERRGDHAAAESHLVAALEALGAEPQAGNRSAIQADRSLVARHAGDDGLAQELAVEARALADASGSDEARARAENLLGLLAGAHGDIAEARAHLSRSLDLAAALPDPGRRIAALNNLALAERGAGALERAIELTLEALRLAERQGDRHREAALQNNLADLHREAGRRDEAMEHLRAAVTLFAEIDDRDELRPGIWQLVEW